MNIFLLTLLLSATHAAAEGNGPGCGSLTFDPACLTAEVPVPVAVPVSTTGLEEKRQGGVVPRRAVAAAYGNLGDASREAEYEGVWRLVLEIGRGQDSGVYSPGVGEGPQAPRLMTIETTRSSPFSAAGVISTMTIGSEVASAFGARHETSFTREIRQGVLSLSRRYELRRYSRGDERYFMKPVYDRIDCKVVRGGASMLCHLRTWELRWEETLEMYGLDAYIGFERVSKEDGR